MPFFSAKSIGLILIFLHAATLASVSSSDCSPQIEPRVHRKLIPVVGILGHAGEEILGHSGEAVDNVKGNVIPKVHEEVGGHVFKQFAKPLDLTPEQAYNRGKVIVRRTWKGIKVTEKTCEKLDFCVVHGDGGNSCMPCLSEPQPGEWSRCNKCCNPICAEASMVKARGLIDQDSCANFNNTQCATEMAP